MKKTEKAFDCIAFKRAAQLIIYEEIKNLSREEEIAYFRHKAETGSFKDWWLRQKTDGAGTYNCAEKIIEYEAKAAKE